MMDPLASLCWLHTQILMLQFLPFPGFQTVRDPGPSCTLNRVVGESVQLPLNHTLSPDIREIEWKWNTEAEQQQLLVSWKPSGPEWYEFEDKYKHRFCLTEEYILNISNLTVEMSGLYVAEIKYNTGKSQKKDFRLCVHEPIPKPQIQIHSLSNTPGWCNVSLECGTPETSENSTVTWLSNGFPRELEQRGTLSAASNSRNLSLSLPLSQSHGHLTCVVSNSADQKNATVDLGSICPQRGSFQSKWLWRGVLIMVLVVSLGAGVWIWKRKKMETERGRSWETLRDGGAGERQWMQAALETVGSLRSPWAERHFPGSSWGGAELRVGGGACPVRKGQGWQEQDRVWAPILQPGNNELALGLVRESLNCTLSMTATVPQAPPRAGSDDPQIGGLDSHDLPYAEISPLRPTEDNLDICLVQTPKPTPAVHTVYEKIHKSPKPKGSPRSGVNLDDDRPW
ncbi:uncharacterized protein LOC124077540 isoform X2 [Marmota monax]|uniref:uncharacterized protein LOC124077540 isoform X2 n=1 Tax=Marmota monax TaxID=9995 RepID=UPI001EB0AABE|nr:uncharacterized protein LOC124077540 isoform X2 [Marmota monax]